MKITLHRGFLKKPAAHVFPPALVPVLRDRLKSKGGDLPDVADEVLVQLLTTIFWAGLETPTRASATRSA